MHVSCYLGGWSCERHSAIPIEPYCLQRGFTHVKIAPAFILGGAVIRMEFLITIVAKACEGAHF